MGTHDIHVALDWLSWRARPYIKKYSQEYRDGIALQKLTELSASPHASENVRVRIAAILKQIAVGTASGDADTACCELSQSIILEADETDFLAILANTPHRLVEWRKLWNKYRAKKTRKATKRPKTSEQGG